MTLAGPWREEQEEPSAAAARDRALLVRVEVEERPGVRLDRLAGGFDAQRSVEHEEERGLLHAVVAERLAGAELDEDGPLGAFPRVQDDGRPRTVRRLDLGKPPMAHGLALPAPAGHLTTDPLDSPRCR